MPNKTWRRALPATLAGSWIFVDLVLLAASFISREQEPTDWWLSTVLGMVFAQLSFGGFWLVMGPGRAAIRIPLVITGTALATAAFFRQVVARNELELRFILFFIVLLLLFQFCLIGLVTFFRRLLRWRVGWEGERHEASTTQFGVRDILLWMAGVGMLITLFRVAFAQVNISNFDSSDLMFDLLVAVVLLSSTLAQAFLAGWGAFGARRRWGTMLASGSSLLLAMMCAAPLGIDGNNFAIVVLILVLQYAFLGGTLALLWWQGLRLVPDRLLNRYDPVELSD